MALRTRSTIDSLVANMIDDPDNQRWSAANLKTFISLVYDQLWSEILEVAPELLQTTDTITSLTSPGYIDVSSGGDLTYRLFRIQSIIRSCNGTKREYTVVDAHDALIDWSDGSIISADDARAFFIGNRLYLTPFDTTTDVDITYSYLPPEYEDLGDSAEIVWPEGHDLALILEAASILISKGGAEDPSPLYVFADKARKQMFSAVKRRRAGSLFVRGNSMSSTVRFGGVE